MDFSDVCCAIVIYFTWSYAPNNVFAHHPSLGGEIGMKLLPRYGAFDNRPLSALGFFIATYFAVTSLVLQLGGD